MANTIRPSTYLNWTDGATNKVSPPPSTLAASGFGAGQPIPFQYLNWLFYETDQWIQFLDGTANATLMATTLDSSCRLSGGGTLSYNQGTGVFSWSAPFYINIPTLMQAVNTIPAGSITVAANQLLYVNANVPFSTQGDVTSGSQTVANLAFEKGIVVGQTVTGSGIATGTSVTAISGTSLTLSIAATGSAAQTNLTFATTGNLTVSGALPQNIVPSANTIVVGRITATASAVMVGINAVEAAIHDGEQRTLSTTGYTGVVPMLAGSSLTALQVCYVSAGSADGSRTAGSVYPADASFTNFQNRGRVLGVVTTACAAGATSNVVTQGVVPGFTGLTAGSSYFLDATTPGGITVTRAGAAIEVGVAVSSTALYLRHSRAVLGLDPSVNSLSVAPISGDPTPTLIALLDASGNKLGGVDGLGNVYGPLLQAGQGTAAAPSQTFLGDGTTGAYLETLSATKAVMAWAINKVKALTLSSTGLSSIFPSSAPSFVSGAGFKAVVDMGTLYGGADVSNNPAANTIYQNTLFPIITSNGISNMSAVYPCTHNGSVIGCSVTIDTLASGITAAVQITVANVGGTSTWVAHPSINNNRAAFQAKGLTPFAFASSISAQVKFSSANAVARVRVQVTIEMDG